MAGVATEIGTEHVTNTSYSVAATSPYSVLFASIYRYSNILPLNTLYCADGTCRQISCTGVKPGFGTTEITVKFKKTHEYFGNCKWTYEIGQN
jgi:hypothetical protein